MNNIVMDYCMASDILCEMPPLTPVAIILSRLSALKIHPSLALGKEVFRIGRCRYVHGYCFACRKTKRYSISNLIAGKSTQCACRRGRKYSDKPAADIIGERYDAIKQRCKPGGKRIQKRYGDRGIRNLFSSRREFVDYVFFLLREKYPNHQGSFKEAIRKHDIDRIDNDGHYVVGNIRLVPRALNLSNRNLTRVVSYEGKLVPAVDLWHLLAHDECGFSFSPEWTLKLAKTGISGEEIIERSRSRRAGGRPQKNVLKINENILIKYGKLPMPQGMKSRPDSYFARCGRI